MTWPPLPNKCFHSFHDTTMADGQLMFTTLTKSSREHMIRPFVSSDLIVLLIPLGSRFTLTHSLQQHSPYLKHLFLVVPAMRMNLCLLNGSWALQDCWDKQFKTSRPWHMSPTLCQSNFVLGSYTDLFHREQQGVSIPGLVTKDTNGQWGQPQQSICLDFLTEVVTNNSCHINLSELAHILGISCMTLWWNMQKHGLKQSYTLLSNNELDLLVRTFKRHKLESGFRYLLGHLQCQGIWVQRKQIWQSLCCVDRLGQHLWEHRVIQCRVYRIKRSNAL